MRDKSRLSGQSPHDRPTLRSTLFDSVRAHPERPALTYRRTGPTPRHARGRRARAATWHTLTWHELSHVVLGLIERLDDIVEPSATVGILAETDARYPVLELALGLSGRSVQPLYATSTDDELRAALHATGATTLVVGRSQLDRARSGRLHGRILALNDVVRLPAVDGTPAATLAAHVEPFDTAPVLGRIAALPTRPAGAALLYLQSTGTTGPARVIEISEDAILASVRAVKGETAPFPRFLSFLPPAHISERLLTLYVSMALAGHTWFGDGLATVASDLRAARPTVLLAPPIMLAAIRDETLAVAASSAVGRRLATSMQRTVAEIVAAGRSGLTRRRLGARILGASVRRKAGLRDVCDAFAGTAPLPADVQAWWEALGVPVRNVYGQTEVAGASSLGARVGSSLAGVGRPSLGVQVRLGAGDELLVRTPSAFTRYVGDAGATARTLTDGWVRTGDRATIDADGEITLRGRMQSLLPGPDGELVDIGPLLGRLAAAVGPACFAVVSAAGGSELVLYVASDPPPLEPGAEEGAGLDALPSESPRWAELESLLRRVDPDLLIRAAGLFDGAFSVRMGEVGPTGKPRGWRIHELRSAHVRDRRSFAADARSAIAV